MTLLLCIIAIAIVIVCILMGERIYKYVKYIYMPDMNHVISNVYLGNWFDSTNWDALRNEGITHILTLNRTRIHTKKQLLEMKSRGISNMYISIDDNQYSDISRHFDKCFSFIRSADKVLVHCSAGVSRSSTVVAAFLINSTKMNADDALSFIRSKRPRVKPNRGFMSQLYKL
jgi:dual specificity phosphatase 12